MKKSLKIIVLIISILIVVGGIVFGTLYFTGFFVHNGNFPRRNFQLNETQINDINSFFSSNPSLSEMQTYCSDNRGSCFYYCRSINPNSEICSQIANYTQFNRTRGGMPPQ
jgi:hypothetical protein